jgi:DNA repair protein RecO (recombination protein O)
MTGRERVFKSEGLVLSHVDAGETDRIITVLSPHHGKLRAIVRGARRVSSRLGGHVEPLTYVTLQLVHGRNMLVVGQVRMEYSFRRLREDLVALSYALEAMRMVDYFVQEGEENLQAFKLLIAFLRRCETARFLSMPYLAFQWKLLAMAGYRPILDACVVCGAHGDLVGFSAIQGGTVCTSCGPLQPGSRSVSRGTLMLMRSLDRLPYERACELKYDARVAPEVQALLSWYLRHVTDGKLDGNGLASLLREPGL